MIKNNRSKKAVSEVIGVILLLAISISLFSIVNFIVFTYPFNPPSSSVNLLATIDNGFIKIKHNYGDPLDLQTKIIIIIGAFSVEREAGYNNYLGNDEKSDNHWSIGESVEIPLASFPSITGKHVEVMIFDHASNQMIMKTDLQKGSYT